MTSELKPCPFCGGEAEIERYGCTRFSTAYRCQDCGCSLETSETFNHGREWNTRAAPVVPELVRYEPDYAVDFRSVTTAYMQSNAGGEYVLYSQAAEIIASKDKEINKLNVYNSSYHNQITELRELLQAAEAKNVQYEAQEPAGWLRLHPDFTPEFSNLRLTGEDFDRGFREEPLYASPAPAADLKAENERLRGALEFYADTSKYPSPLTGGMGALWEDCGQIGRAALNVEASNG